MKKKIGPHKIACPPETSKQFYGTSPAETPAHQRRAGVSAGIFQGMTEKDREFLKTKGV